MKFSVIVPTLNPGKSWMSWLNAFAKQTARPSDAIVIDSGSAQDEIDLAIDYGFRIIRIPGPEFNHGGTRQSALDRLEGDCEVAVFLTQDAILYDQHSLERLLMAFQDPEVAAAYGRQIPRSDSGPFGAHARLFNYGPLSGTRSLGSVSTLGFKACFISNSFAAYRLKDLRAVGGFSADLILGEDACLAARLLQSKKKVAYVAEACVIHSHDYTIFEEFRRYFDTGVFHAQRAGLIEQFGEATGEGKAFVLSELSYLLRKAPYLIPWAFIRNGFKLIGYRLGRNYKILPGGWVRAMSMYRGFWDKQCS